MDIALLQNLLIARGAAIRDAERADEAAERPAEFGPDTAVAVQTFQENAGLPVTGLPDAATWAALPLTIATEWTVPRDHPPLDDEDPRVRLEAEPTWLARARFLTSPTASPAPEWFRRQGFETVQVTPESAAAVFIGAVLALSGLQTTGNFASRSYDTWGSPLAGPAPGAIVTARGEHWYAEAGIVIEDKGTTVRIATAECVPPIGPEDAATLRPVVTAIDRSAVIAYRWPASVQ